MTAAAFTGLVGMLGGALTGCAGADNPTSPSRAAGSDVRGRVTVGAANFPESKILGAMYATVLARAGYRVEERFGIGSREAYVRAMRAGEVDLVPEYLGTLTEYLNVQQHGPTAPTTAPQASGNPDRTASALTRLLHADGDRLRATPYARRATDQNSFAVTRQTARRYGLHRLSDLGKPEVRGRLVLGAGADCAVRPLCWAGLQRTYGARFRESDGAYRRFANPGDASTLAALRDGTIDVGLVFTSDGSVDRAGLVRLEDDRKLQPADNICGLLRSGALDRTALDLVDRVNQRLTTDDLKELNRQFTVDRDDADTIAVRYLKSRDLL